MNDRIDELKRAIKNEYDYYLDTTDQSLNIKTMQQILADNGYLLTGQCNYTMIYEKPNKHDTFNVKNRHREYNLKNN